MERCPLLDELPDSEYEAACSAAPPALPLEVLPLEAMAALLVMAAMGC